MPTSSAIRIVIVEDHALVRDGLAKVLGAETDFHIVATHASGEAFLKNLDADNPDIVLLDVRLPGLDGIATLTQLRLRRPNQRALMVSSQETDEAIYRALRAGAVGFVLKKQPSRELVEAIRQGMQGQAAMSAEVSVLLARRLATNELTAREIEIVRSIAGGRSNKEIADQLGISHNTVKNHIVVIMTKLSASDRTHAVTIALQRGLIDL